MVATESFMYELWFRNHIIGCHNGVDFSELVGFQRKKRMRY